MRHRGPSGDSLMRLTAFAVAAVLAAAGSARADEPTTEQLVKN